MERFIKLKKKVDDIYLFSNQTNTRCEEWADYLHSNHIYIVAENAKRFSEIYGANTELTMASAILHDIADAVMDRFDKAHEKKSSEIARDFLSNSGFSEEEIRIIVDDAMKYHSCHGDELPKTLEGKILATADGYTHLMSDFYPNRITKMTEDESLEKAKNWALPKIDRDLNEKIFFDEIREEVRSRYEFLKNYINNL